MKQPQPLLSELRELREAFSNRKVLTGLLSEMFFFQDLECEAGQIALHNCAKKLLRRMGIWTPANRKEIVEKLFEIIVKAEDM